MLDAYKIGVTLSLTNHVSKGLMLLAGDFAKTEAQATLLQKRINSIRTDALKGGLLLGAGVGMLALFKGPLDEAKKFQTETAKFASLGFGDKVTAQAVKFATGMQTVGTSARDNLTLLSDAMAVFKNIDHAEFAAPIMAKMKFANEAVFGQKGGEHSTKFMDMLKVIEFRGGLSSEKEFATQANFVQQVISGSRNRVDATQLLSALKTGGVALSRRSNDQFFLGAEPLIQEFGGQRYGTGAMSIYQNLVQSRGTITAQQELYRLGLLNPSMVEFNKLGKLKKSKAGAFQGSGVLETEGELALLEKVLLPAFANKGITGDENIIRELGMIIGNRTGSGLMARIYQQREQIKMQQSANRGAENIDQLSTRANGTLAGKEIDLHAKFNTLMLALGNTVLPLAIKAMEKLIPAVKSMSEWIERNQTLVKSLSLAFVGLGVGLALRGTVLLLTAAFNGLGLAMAMRAAGGLTGISGISSGLAGIGGGLGKIGAVGGLASLGSVLGSLASGLALLGGATAGMAWLLDKVSPNDPATGRAQKNAHALDWLRGGAPAGMHYQRSGRGQTLVADAVAPSMKYGEKMINNTIVMPNGEVLAKVVTKEMTKSVMRPQAGTGRFDGTQMPSFAGGAR